MQKQLYVHKYSHDNIFSFPITGMSVNTELVIGKVKFINKESVNKYPFLLNKNDFIQKYFKNVETIAIVDISGINTGGYTDNSTLALQFLKQSIGIIYMYIYKNIGIDDERRIVISTIGTHEIDEGLNPYFSENNYYNTADMSSNLMRDIVTLIELEITNMNKIALECYASEDEMRKKVLKSLELLYCLYNEQYSNERILKICAFLNYIFREDDDYKLESPALISRLVQLFNYYQIDIRGTLEHRGLYHKDYPKLKNHLENIYVKIRNSFVHGKINFYEEFTVININEYMIYKFIFMELLNLLITNQELKEIKTSRELNKQINYFNTTFRDSK